MGVQPVNVNVSIVTTVVGQNAKYVVFTANIHNNTNTYAAKYSDNLYGAIRSKVLYEYFKSGVGGIEI